MVVLNTTDLPLLSKRTGLLYPKCQHSLHICISMASIIINISKRRKKINRVIFLIVKILIKNITVYFIEKSSKLSIS